MLVMASMSWCMLFNFMVLLGFIMADFVPWGETQLSGGLCCGGKRCHHGDAYLWTKWTENSTLTNLIDASSSSSRLGGTCVTSLPLPPPRTLFIGIHVDRTFVTQLIQDCYSSSEYCRPAFVFESLPNLTEARNRLLQSRYDDCGTNLKILRACQVTLVLSGFLMAIAHAASVLNLVAVYRKHMMRFYRGQTTFLSKFVPGPYVALTDCLKYDNTHTHFVHPCTARASS
jgi:hypothetical protein